jgi:hypothetical protein
MPARGIPNPVIDAAGAAGGVVGTAQSKRTRGSRESQRTKPHTNYSEPELLWIRTNPTRESDAGAWAVFWVRTARYDPAENTKDASREWSMGDVRVLVVGGNVVDESPVKPYHFQCSRIRHKSRSNLVDLRIMHL